MLHSNNTLTSHSESRVETSRHIFLRFFEHDSSTRAGELETCSCTNIYASCGVTKILASLACSLEFNVRWVLFLVSSD